MNRRAFLSNGIWLLAAPTILVPRRTLAQAFTWNDPAFMAQQKAAAAGGGGGGIIGDNTIEASSIGPDASQIYAFRAQATSGGTLGSAFMYHDGSTASGNAKLAIYTSNNTTPATDTARALVGVVSGALNGGGAAQWVSSAIGSGTVTNGAFYWIVIYRDTTVATWATRYNGSGTLFFKTVDEYTTPPTTMDSAGWSNGAFAPLSAYVTLT